MPQKMEKIEAQARGMPYNDLEGNSIILFTQSGRK